jgi:DNA-binding response OmpR family regulator
MRVLADGKRPSAAVVDWDLPGMSGLELIEHMEKTAPETRAVLVTGAARERVEAAARKHGVTYMRKPLNFKTLLQMLPAADARRNKRGERMN